MKWLPKVYITGAGAGVDSAWEQRKLEARKMLVNRADSHTSGAPIKMAGNHFSREKPPASCMEKYTPKWQVNKPYKAMETRRVAVPRCTVVAGQIDLYTGGEGAKTPMRKLNP